MVVLPRYISAGNRPADGPLLGGGRSAPGGWTVRSWGVDGPLLGGERPAVISDVLEQNRFWLCWWSKMNCGPSGPWVRTVRL